MIRLIIVVFMSVFMTSVLAQDAGQTQDDDEGKVIFSFEVGITDETSLEKTNILGSVDFTKTIGKETRAYAITEKQDVFFELTPGISLGQEDIELDTGEKKTTTLSLRFASLKWMIHDKLIPSLSIGYGEQEIEETDEAGNTTTTDEKVFIWNAEIEYKLNNTASVKYTYKLTQEDLFSDKVEHSAVFGIKFNIGRKF